MWTFCLELLVTDLKSSSILSIYPFKFSSSPFYGLGYVQERVRRFWYTLFHNGILVRICAELCIPCLCLFQYWSSYYVWNIDNSKIVNSNFTSEIWNKKFPRMFLLFNGFFRFETSVGDLTYFLKENFLLLVVKFTCVTHM